MSGCNCKNSLKPCGDCKCVGAAGAAGADGTNGLSAYEIWINEGNVGTEQDFLDSLVGATGPAGADGAPGVPNPKINFYEEVISTVEVGDGLPDPTVYHFPTGYGTLTYTNSTGVSRDYLVTVSYDTQLNDGGSDLYHVVDGAIIKTVGAVDSAEYENLGETVISASLYDGATDLDIVNIGTAETINTTPSGNPSEFRFRDDNIKIPFNVSFFKKITLDDTDSVSLKFKVPKASENSTLLQAQIFVLELD